MKENYFKTVIFIERLHRLFLEVLKIELERMKIWDINNVQCLALYNIGNKQVNVGDLTKAGYYQGSNFSYNLRKMVQKKYIIREKNPYDGRSSYVKLSDKGINLLNQLESLFDMHAKAISMEGIDESNADKLDEIFRKLEGFWGSLLNRDLMS